MPDYVWQRVDQWPDKVATVSMHRAYKHLHVISRWRWIAQCNAAAGHKSTDGICCKAVSREHKKTVLWEHITLKSR